MKHIILLSLFLTILANLSYSQNVGINNTDPKATLDIKGDIIFRVDTLNLVNGINNNIDIITTKSMNYIIMGPNTTFEIGGFTGGENGRIITLYNSSPAAYYVKHFSGGTLPENQINTGIGADFLMNSYSTLTFQYLALDNLWHVVSSFGKIESNTSNTTLSSTPSDTSILANFIFTTGITSIENPVNTMPGNSQLLGFVDDQSTANLLLPFNIIFDGKTYSNFSVCSNGFIKLYSLDNQSTNCTHINDLNSTNLPVFALMWDDLHMINPGGGVWMVTEGISPDRIFHIEFICNFYNQFPNNLRIRFSYFENSHKIQYTYFQTTSPTFPGNGGFSIGMASADYEVLSVNTGNNISSSQEIKNDNYVAPSPGRYYCWEQNLTTISNININSPLSNQSLNINGDLNIRGRIINETQQAATLESGWNNFITAEFYKDREDVVHLNGLVNKDQGAVGSAILKLPSKYTPKADRYFTVVNSLQSGTIKIQPNGNVIFFSGVDGNVSLDGISFRARN